MVYKKKESRRVVRPKEGRWRKRRMKRRYKI
jgi:hypothetical protein